MSGLSESLLAVPSDGLWSEDGDRVWLPMDYADNSLRVKRMFFLGRGIPTCPARDGAPYEHLRVSREYIRPGEPDESGWAGSGAEMWWACDYRHPKAVEAWTVTYAD